MNIGEEEEERIELPTPKVVPEEQPASVPERSVPVEEPIPEKVPA